MFDMVIWESSTVTWMSWCMEWELHSYSNLVLFYPFLRAPGNIHSNTKKWRQNQKYGYEQNQRYTTWPLVWLSKKLEKLYIILSRWQQWCEKSIKYLSIYVDNLIELAKCAGQTHYIVATNWGKCKSITALRNPSNPSCIQCRGVAEACCFEVKAA